MPLDSPDGLLSGGGRLESGPRCCCCKNCCHKFCGDEYIVNGLIDGGVDVLALSGDTTWRIQPGSSQITIGNPNNRYCGVKFEFLVTITNADAGTECVDVPGVAWLCNDDHRDEGLYDCVCVCHWHVEIEACSQDIEFCDNDCTWVWRADQGIWENTVACQEGCSCADPDAAGEQDGDIATTFCNVNEFPAMSFVGGDSCLNVSCDAPVCGDCGTTDIAAAEIIDPDYSVACCCLDIYDTGEV